MEEGEIMGEQNLFGKILDEIREIISSTSWKIFLWSIRLTDEEYWESIYWQEKVRKEETP